MVVLFSGRFDPPHPGHIATIVKLAKMFDEVIVPVLDHEGQSMTVEERVKILEACLPEDVTVWSNKQHFGRITKEELDTEVCQHGNWGGHLKNAFDIYSSGNEQCCEHMKSLGYPVLYMPRSFHYSGTEERAKHGKV